MLASLLAAGGPAAAQGEDEVFSPPTTPTARLHVTALTLAEPGGGDPPDLTVRAIVENRGTETLDDLAFLVEVFAAAPTRSELHLALDRNTPVSAFLDAERVDLEPLAPRAVAGAEVIVPGTEIGWGDDGVHPVRITVVQGREALDEVTTAAILDRVGAPLRIVVGWPLDAMLSGGPGGAYSVDAVEHAAPGSRLERLVWVLERTPGIVVQPLLGPHLFEDLADLADGFVLDADTGPSRVAEDDERAGAAADLIDRTRAAVLDRAPPLVGPYADADLSGLVAQGLAIEALQHVADAPRRLERTLAVRPASAALWGTVPITAQALRDVLGPARIRTLLLGWSQIQPDIPDRTPSPLRRLLAGGTEITAVVGDPWLEQLLSGLPTAHGPQVAAQRLLAETAMVHLERPFDRSRGLVMLPPPRWDPDPRAAVAVLRALADAPWLEPVSVEALVSGWPRLPGRAGLVSDVGTLSGDVARSLRSARQQLGLLQESLVEPGPGVDGRSWSDLDTQLLRAASTWHDASTSQRLVDDVRAVVSSGFGTVALADGASVTLTAEEGTIPVSLSRPEGEAIRVLVQVESSKLDFPDGRTQEVMLDRGAKRTISFPTVAHASGRIPVTVRVIAPGGGLVLDATTVVVRSSHVSSTALAVLGTILAVLLLWWLVRRRRPRPPRLRIVEEEAA